MLNNAQNLESNSNNQKESVSDLLDLYGAAADIEFAIDDQGISESEPKPDWTELQKVIGVWQEDTEIQEIFAEIDRERHLD